MLLQPKITNNCLILNYRSITSCDFTKKSSKTNKKIERNKSPKNQRTPIIDHEKNRT